MVGGIAGQRKCLARMHQSERRQRQDVLRAGPLRRPGHGHELHPRRCRPRGPRRPGDGRLEPAWLEYVAGSASMPHNDRRVCRLRWTRPSLEDGTVAVHQGIWTRFPDSRRVARDAYTHPAGRSTGFRRLSSVGQSDAFVMRRSGVRLRGGSQQNHRSAPRANRSRLDTHSS